ncbi:hypothetical protein EK904_012855 [Melospiza melodia maxima]|nr:hypothetical protein EK904_012855 [Melospiza melodia maxima]
MIFLTLQRSWKILRRMWKPRRNLLMTSPEREMFPRSTLCVQQGCNFYLSGSKGQVEGWHGRLLHS